MDHCIVQYAENQEVFTLELVNVYCHFNYSHDFGMDVIVLNYELMCLTIFAAM